jgi:hypothetical protein
MILKKIEFLRIRSELNLKIKFFQGFTYKSISANNHINNNNLNELKY